MAQHGKSHYGSVGGHHHANQYLSGPAQHMGPTSHIDGRIPKKGSAQSKHKVHGMNQSMDAGMGGERYPSSGHGLAAGFAGLKAGRGDRQSYLGGDQHMQAHQQQR